MAETETDALLASQMMSPSEKTSDALALGSPSATSGAM